MAFYNYPMDDVIDDVVGFGVDYERGVPAGAVRYTRDLAFPVLKTPLQVDQQRVAPHYRLLLQNHPHLPCPHLMTVRLESHSEII